MAITYTINYSDASSDVGNKQPFSISPGEINGRTSLKLPGQGAALYGEHIAESFLHTLENFCGRNPPRNPTKGQLWYDSNPNIQLLKVLQTITTGAGGEKTYDWVPVGKIEIAQVQPEETGSLWYDTSNADPKQHQLKIFNEITGVWTSVADGYVAKTGDSITGNIKAIGPDVGLVGFTGTEVNGVVNKFLPSTVRGPTILGSQHATLMISSAGNGGHSFIISSGQLNPAVADNPLNAILRVKDSGEVQVVRGNLNLTSNKITNLGAGTLPTDGVNFGQLTSTNDAVAAVVDVKVNRAGDTMTGQLVINTAGVLIGSGGPASEGPGRGRWAMVVNGTGSNSGGILVKANDTGVWEKGIEIINPYGIGGIDESVFSVRSKSGNTFVGGKLEVAKTLDVTGTSKFTGAVTLNSVSTMNVTVAAINDNIKHLTTKEYVDIKVESVRMKGNFAEINPSDAKNGDIRIDGSGINTRIEIRADGTWKQVFPALWSA